MFSPSPIAALLDWLSGRLVGEGDPKNSYYWRDGYYVAD